MPFTGTSLPNGAAHCGASITAVVLTYNEERNIEHCLASVAKLMPVFVVDSGSTDATRAICERYDATVLTHPYANHAAQWEWALQNAPIATKWVLTLDADFAASPELLARIESELRTVPESVAGIYIRHLYHFGGGPIRFGGTKQSWLRIVRLGRATPDRGDLVDFRFVVDGDTLTWPESVVEYNRNDDDSSVWHAKQEKFALRLAVEEELRRRHLHTWVGTPKLFGNTDERFAWLRDRWLNLPLFIRPCAYFLYRYILAGGFLDGRAGFIYHFFQGMWLRLLVDWKTLELRALDLDDATLLTFSRTMLETRTGSVREVTARLVETSHIRPEGQGMPAENSTIGAKIPTTAD